MSQGQELQDFQDVQGLPDLPDLPDLPGRPLRAMLVCSVGGHLTQMVEIVSQLEAVDYFYVINFRNKLPQDILDRTVFIRHAERNWKLLVNFWEGVWLCWCRRPDVIVSTGAGQIIPITFAAKLFGIPVIFIESMSRVVRPSLTGRIMYRLADHFFYQWPGLKPYFPHGTYTGPLL